MYVFHVTVIYTADIPLSGLLLEQSASGWVFYSIESVAQ